MDEVIERFLDYLRVDRRCSENTLLAYRADLRQMNHHIQTHLGKPSSPGDLTGENLRRYGERLAEAGYRPTTVTRKLAAVRSFLEYVAAQGGAAADAGSALRPPKLPRPNPRTLSREELDRLLSAPMGSRTPRALRDAAVLALLYVTGLRASEIVRLRIENIDLERRALLLNKPQGLREPLALDRAYEPIRRYLEEGRPVLSRRPDQAALFLNPRGEQLSRQGLWLIIKRWARASDLEDAISPHTLRHTLARHLLESGQTRRQIQRRLGSGGSLSQPARKPRP